MIRPERIQPTLRDRVFPLFRFRNDQTWIAVFLISGSARVFVNNTAIWLEAPGIYWAEASGEQSLHIGAGSEGYQVSIATQVLLNAIGHNPDSIELRKLADRNLVVNLAADQEAVSAVERVFLSVLEEHASDALGMQSIIEANLKALLVLLWRNAGEYTGVGSPTSRQNRILQHFRQLLESHFRDRWKVRQYANEIGISVDRLHEICTGALMRAPLDLIHERANFEARQLLANTTLTIEQISHRLGFRDPSHFSKHFKLKSGLAPKDYRTRVHVQQDADSRQLTMDYAEWP